VGLSPTPSKPTLNIALPVYNEEVELAQSVRTLVRFLAANLADFDWRVTIADNASTDRTLAIAQELAATEPSVNVVHLPAKGRGRAVKRVWTEDTADIVGYMDIDLSTDLKHLPPLVHALQNGYDVALGSRNLRPSQVSNRSLTRTITSKGYIFLIRMMFPVTFSDAQCGFKAVTRRAVCELVPKVVDDEWFFDTELLILAEEARLRIFEEPVTWTDNPGSTVRVWKTAKADLDGLWRLYRRK
jgi:glycosyltransferase involved in cell wall biosynthesis